MTDLTPFRDLLRSMLVALEQADTGEAAHVPLGEPEAAQPADGHGGTWAERLWVVPLDTRLGMAELCEALRRPRSYVYRATSRSQSDPLPGKKLGGEWSFRVGDVRAWVERNELQP